ncbi:hypothetical protein [Paenibacillus sp. WLX2291]|uniref:hypothetical protein n=1 Tax=Paenibacillus sp. WLX2291 TaxID=3296934 RepID=UPI003983E5EA
MNDKEKQLQEKRKFRLQVIVVIFGFMAGGFILLNILLAGMPLFAFAFWFKEITTDYSGAEQSIIQHLEKTYNEPFELTNIQSPLLPDDYLASARPIHHTEIKFGIKATVRKRVVESWKDDYLKIKWQAKAEQEFQSIAKQGFPANAAATVRIYQGKSYPTYDKQITTFSDFVNQYPQTFNTYITVVIASKQGTQQNYIHDIEHLVHVLKQHGFGPKQLKYDQLEVYFMDVDSLPKGREFQQVVQEEGIEQTVLHHNDIIFKTIVVDMDDDYIDEIKQKLFITK